MTSKTHQIGRKIWFKSKRYGWGWAPATWQGWLILAIWLTIVVAFVLNIDSQSSSIGSTLLTTLPFVMVMSLILVMISYGRGEKPKTHWLKQHLTKKKRTKKS